MARVGVGCALVLLSLTGAVAQHGDVASLIQNHVNVRDPASEDLNKLASQVTFDTDAHHFVSNAVTSLMKSGESEEKPKTAMFSADGINAMVQLSLAGMEKIDTGFMQAEETLGKMTSDSKMTAERLMAAIPKSDAEVANFEGKLNALFVEASTNWMSYIKQYKEAATEILEFYENGPGQKVVGGPIFAKAMFSSEAVKGTESLFAQPLLDAIQLTSVTTGSVSETKEKLMKINTLLEGSMHRIETLVELLLKKNGPLSIDEILTGPLAILIPAPMKEAMRNVGHHKQDIATLVQEFGNSMISVVQLALVKM